MGTASGFARRRSYNWPGVSGLKRLSCIACLHAEWATSMARRPSASVRAASEGTALTASPSQSAWAASVRVDPKKRGTASGLASRKASIKRASEGVALTASPSQLAWAASVRMDLKKAGTASGLASRKACSWSGVSLCGSTMRRRA
eukprot:scaffold3543_cov61-Phaeocystis_antarctica.AAC.3